jgi:hypothetical protein
VLPLDQADERLDERGIELAPGTAPRSATAASWVVRAR